MTDLSKISQKEVIKGFFARFIHTPSMTLGFWDVSQGSVMPMHKHIHEQVTQVEEGAFELTINGDTRTYTKGMVAVIAPNIEHSGRAITDCKLFDIFHPVREDYKNL
jgi:quercetin dioxygenase-like cupin family protein